MEKERRVIGSQTEETVMRSGRFLSIVFAAGVAIWAQGWSAWAQQVYRGWWPRGYRIERNEAAGVLTLSTPYYAF